MHVLIILITIMPNAKCEVSQKSSPSPIPVAQNLNSAPLCVRPLDMAIEKDVAHYISCRIQLGQFCNGHEKMQECIKYRETLGPAKSVTRSEGTSADRCVILKDGSYNCNQDPVRFVLKDESKGSVPTSSPAPLSSESNPGEGGTTTQPAGVGVPK